MAFEERAEGGEALTSTRDWRSRLLVLLALIPIGGAVAISVMSWIDEAEEIAVYEGETYPIKLSHQIHVLSSTLETASISLHAAALPDAGPEIMDRAVVDRERALEAIELAEGQSPELASVIASEIGVDPTPFLLYMDETFEVVDEQLQDQEPGQPVSDRLVSSIETIDRDFGSNSINMAGWDAEANLRIGAFRSLSEYRSSLTDELQLILATVGEAVAPADADPARLAIGTQRRADAWNEMAPTITALPDVERYQLLRISPTTPVEIDPAEGLAETAASGLTVAERDRLILDGLAIDDRVGLDVAHTTNMLLDDLDALIAERRSRQVTYLIGGVVLLVLGLALLVVARSETRRRQRVENAHADALSRLDTTASRDPLTGVWNRRHLDEQLSHLLQNRSTVGSLVVAYVDLDRFKAINDVWGHATGDEILQIVARRLSAVTITSLEPVESHEQASGSANGRPSQDANARINVEVVRSGGDEFICYVPLVDPQVSTVADLGTKLIAVVSRPIVVDGQRHYIGATAGLAISDEASTSDSLLLEADSSLILAKRNQRGTASVYNRRVSRSSELVKALPKALGNGQISCSYQPVIDLASGNISHLEALARWTKPDGEEIDPSEFVPLVESFGMASRLTEVVLATIAEYQHGQAAPETGRIWLNVAPVELEVSDFAVRLFRMIERLEVEPERLGIEITETAAIGDPVHFANQLHQLKGIGMMTAIDDFGSGYSPLGYLKDLPVDLVKLDRSLISEIDTSPEYQQIVRGIIALTTELGMATAAEGVERPEELEWAASNGISYVQGFLVGQPSAAADIDWSRRLHDPVATSS